MLFLKVVNSERTKVDLDPPREPLTAVCSCGWVSRGLTPQNAVAKARRHGATHALKAVA